MSAESELRKRIATLSPAQQAALAQRLRERDKHSERDRIPRRDPQQPAPLSFAQERLWFLAALEPESRAYNSSKAYHLRGPLNVVALQRSFAEILRRHESLRTTFSAQDGRAVQVIAPSVSVNFRTVDLTVGSREVRFEQAMQWAEEEFTMPFDLTTGPLMRVALLHLDEQEHVLIVTFHHIVYDGWSANVLGRELSAFYNAFQQGRRAEWPDLPIQYADYAIWQRQRLSGAELELRLEFWRKQLAGATALDLLTDRPRPAHQTYRGDRYLFTLSSDLTARLEKFNRQERVTLFMSLLAAFAVLLFRRSGQEDIVVGTPIANRSEVELEELIGFFVNSLVMRVDLAGGPSFREVVKRIRQTALDAYQHQDLPFERLVEDINPDRHLSRHPLFQVMFAVQNAPRQVLKLSGLEAIQKSLPSSSTRFDMELHFRAEENGLNGWLVYNRDLFEEASVEAMARQYVALLEGMLAQPESSVGLVPMMSDSERKRILVEWNATRVDYPSDRCLHELFEEQARRSPQAVAVVFGEEAICYGDLNDRSTQLARHLRSLGVRGGAKVAVCLEPSVEMMVGLLATMKAGAAYVPIDPDYPKERISLMLAETEAAALLTRKELAPRFANDSLKIVCLDETCEALECREIWPQSGGAVPEDPAYIIFTSGSTGKPKGVCVPHRAVNRLVVNCDYVQLGAEDVVAQISNCCFDAATFEIWGALLNGSRLVGIALEDALSAERLFAKLSEHEVTTLFVTTALFNELVYERPDIFANLRTVLFGGEECDPGAVKKVLESTPPQRLVHVYGPTETTTFATWHQIAPGEDCAGRIPIGRPIANTQIYLLDTHLNAVPIGVAGEIWIGGEGVASGYLNQPELTAESFVPSPFVSGQKLYRSGDVGRFLPDGRIEFLGRRDRQVKIRGFRIEPGEIDSVLRQHAGVAGTALVVRGEKGQKQLVAYFVAAVADQTPTSTELREFLRSKLPDYMVPSVFVALDKLPLTPHGKIDVNALPAPEASVEGENWLEPRNETERTVADVWSLVLDLKGIGVHDDFFELGGHSLLATRVVSRLRSIFNVDIPLRVLFDNPTVAALAEFIESARSTTSEASPTSSVAENEDVVL